MNEITQSEAPLQVIVFDLNKTFYNESSKDKFYDFICTKRPWRIKYIFEMAYYKLLRNLHQIRKTEFKENFFNYLNGLTPEQVAGYATEFWAQEYPVHFNQELKARFDKMKAQGLTIFCATGGLELYVAPLFRLYAIDGFAGTKTHYEGHTYKVDGKACKDEEKLRRMHAYFQGQEIRIVEAYSDSKEAILEKAQCAYLLRNGKIEPFKNSPD